MPKIVGVDLGVYKRITCQHCGSINQYVPVDIKTLWYGKDYSGSCACSKGFNCAHCNKEIITEDW